ncbi:NADP-dependent oxidoreductase [Salinisphaera sp. SPP-AMP-43]|uniref:quinone oxidoreductase family protein n=1 Tax=Salinisphaera sp. SPP-AMP-43 TaxID=3121288 RepID=UPI003C6E093F
MFRLTAILSVAAALFTVSCAQAAQDPADTKSAHPDHDPQTMKAIGLYQYGGPEVLGVVTVAKPEPKPKQVRIRVMAAGVNPVDQMVREGALADYYEGHDFPYIPGMDVSGVVDQIGNKVDPALGLETGMDVTAIVSNFAGYGGYSQYINVPAESVIPMPKDRAYSEAASFLTTAMTAQTALNALDLPKGSSLLVIGAAGSVGTFASVLAEQDGLEVVGIASSSDESDLRSYGISHFIARGEDANDQVRQIYPKGVDAVIDTAGIRTRAFPALKDNGEYIALRDWKDAPDIRGIRVTRVDVRDHITDHAAIAKIGHLVEQGVLPIRIAKVFPSSKAAAAHELLATHGVRGKIVLDMSEITGAPAPQPND